MRCGDEKISMLQGDEDTSRVSKTACAVVEGFVFHLPEYYCIFTAEFCLI
jgi:hypothetical protein